MKIEAVLNQINVYVYVLYTYTIQFLDRKTNAAIKNTEHKYQLAIKRIKCNEFKYLIDCNNPSRISLYLV